MPISGHHKRYSIPGDGKVWAGCHDNQVKRVMDWKSYYTYRKSIGLGCFGMASKIGEKRDSYVEIWINAPCLVNYRTISTIVFMVRIAETYH